LGVAEHDNVGIAFKRPARNGSLVVCPTHPFSPPHLIVSGRDSPFAADEELSLTEITDPPRRSIAACQRLVIKTNRFFHTAQYLEGGGSAGGRLIENISEHFPLEQIPRAHSLYHRATYIHVNTL